VGGDITEPAVLYKVHPEYPSIAQAAMLEGIVILEATVDGDGRVESVRVLRSKGVLLDRAAVDAVKQWRYSPLIFHGRPHPFILTVTVSFSLERRR
jgi:protein TonB